jgi:hypothetical protein
MPLGLAMDLGDQRAGRVDIEQLAALPASAGTDFGTPCAEKITGASAGTSSSSSTKIAPFSAVLDHEAVVHDLVAHIDGAP